MCRKCMGYINICYIPVSYMNICMYNTWTLRQCAVCDLFHEKLAPIKTCPLSFAIIIFSLWIQWLYVRLVFICLLLCTPFYPWVVFQSVRVVIGSCRTGPHGGIGKGVDGAPLRRLPRAESRSSERNVRETCPAWICERTAGMCNSSEDCYFFSVVLSLT